MKQHVFEGGRKEPFYVHLADPVVLRLRGPWDRRRQAEGTEPLSCALVTVSANSLMQIQRVQHESRAHLDFETDDIPAED